MPLDVAACPVVLAGPEALSRSFLVAVVNGLPRTPAADVAAGHDAGVRLSLLVEISGLSDATAVESAEAPVEALSGS